jgi:hypothetical protein
MSWFLDIKKIKVLKIRWDILWMARNPRQKNGLFILLVKNGHSRILSSRISGALPWGDQFGSNGCARFVHGSQEPWVLATPTQMSSARH